MTLATNHNGSGVPIVLLHAFPLSKKMWASSAYEFSRHYQPIQIDFPGFGDSAAPTDEYSMEQLADQVLTTLTEKGIKEKFVLAGVSMGGYVAFQIMKKAPQRVRALALISTKATADSDEARAKRFANIELVQKEGVPAFIAKAVPGLLGETSRKIHSEQLEQAMAWGKDASAAGIIGALKAMASRPDMTATLSAITVPTLVVSGGEDSVIKTQEMSDMAQQINKAEFQLIEKSGHLPPLETTSIFNELFSQFLKRRVL